MQVSVKRMIFAANTNNNIERMNQEPRIKTGITQEQRVIF